MGNIRTSETKAIIDTAKLQSTLKTAALPFIGATDDKEGLQLTLDGRGCAAGFDNGDNSRQKLNGVYFMPEELQKTSDAEIAFIRKNFDAKPFTHTYYDTGKFNVSLGMSQKDITDTNDADFAAIVRTQGLAITTGKTTIPPDSKEIRRAKTGATVVSASLLTSAVAATLSLASLVIGAVGSIAVSSIALPASIACIAVAAGTALTGMFSHRAFDIDAISRKFEEENCKNGKEPFKVFSQSLAAKMGISTPAVAAEQNLHQDSTFTRKITLDVNHAFDKPANVAKTPVAAPTTTNAPKKDATL